MISEYKQLKHTFGSQIVLHMCYPAVTYRTVLGFNYPVPIDLNAGLTCPEVSSDHIWSVKASSTHYALFRCNCSIAVIMFRGLVCPDQWIFIIWVLATVRILRTEPLTDAEAQLYNHITEGGDKVEKVTRQRTTSQKRQNLNQGGPHCISSTLHSPQHLFPLVQCTANTMYKVFMLIQGFNLQIHEYL